MPAPRVVALGLAALAIVVAAVALWPRAPRGAPRDETRDATTAPVDVAPAASDGGGAAVPAADAPTRTAAPAAPARSGTP